MEVSNIKDTVRNSYKIKICLLLGVVGFFLNFLPLSLSYGGLNLSVLVGVFFALFVAQVWGLKYGLLTALFGSTQSMWFMWQGNGFGMLYAVPVFTVWVVWHGYWADKRRSSKKKIFWYNKYIQEIVIRLIIEAGFWTVFTWLISLNPSDMPGVAHSVPQSWLWNIFIKHTANAYIMLLLTEVLINVNAIKRIFLIEEKEKNPGFLIAFVLLWIVLFWYLESSLMAGHSEELLKFYQTYQNPNTLEMMLVHYPASSFWLRIIFAIFFSLAAYMIYSLYVSERKNYKRFHNLFERSNDIIMLCDQNGKILETNSNARALFPEGESTFHLETLLSDEKKKIFEHLQERDDDLRFSTQFGKSTSVTYDCLINCVDQEKRQWLLIARDITERVEMEEKLNQLNTEIEASYEELQSSFEELESNNILLGEQNDLINILYNSMEEIMNAVPDWIIRIDQQYKIQWVNKAFKKYIGYDLTGMDFSEQPYDNGFRLKKEYFDQLFPCGNLKTITQRIDDELVVQITSLPANSNDDIILVIRDITKIKMREKYYREAKEAAERASKLKDEFLANISHELRTPMNGILTSLNLINYSANTLDSETKEYLSIIRQSSTRLLRTINELLEVKRIENHKVDVNMAPINTAEFVEDFRNQFSIFAKQKNIAFEIKVGKGFPKYFLSDEDKIVHILSNLVFNAVKFTEKGFVKIKLDSECVDEIKRRLTFSVIDSGIGIAKDKQKLIFDKFSQVDNSYTRRYEGTGLGLAISKNLVLALNSMLKLQSEEGRGSTFYFTLESSVCDEKISNKISMDETTLQRIKDRQFNIFLAEDDLINRKVLQRLLENYNCNVEVFENGKELLERIEIKQPELILMDIEMPVMNGMETNQQLKSKVQYNDIPVIALTAHAFENKKSEFLDGGFDHCLTKPINKCELIRIFLEYV